MKTFKAICLVCLLLLTTLSFSLYLIAADPITVTSKGKAKAYEHPNGLKEYECDNSDDVTCTISIPQT